MQVGYAMTTFHRETEQPVIGFDMGGNERIKHYHVIWSWIGLIFLLEICYSQNDGKSSVKNVSLFSI